MSRGHALTEQQIARTIVAPAARMVDASIRRKLLDLEAELDEIAPEWTRKDDGHIRVKPFGHVPPGPWKARLQWVLKRHQVLMSGRDIRVVMADHPRGAGEKVAIAIPSQGYTPGHPGEPARVRAHHRPEVVREKPPKAIAQPIEVALALGIPLETAERLLLRCPAHADDAIAWCRENLAQA